MIYMSFHKMVFYLKDANVKIRCDHTPLHEFVYSVTKNDKVNNWSHKMHAITPYIDFTTSTKRQYLSRQPFKTKDFRHI